MTEEPKPAPGQGRPRPGRDPGHGPSVRAGEDRVNGGGRWFRDFHDAVFEAHFRAALVRRRYRVRYDARNRWWNLTETTQPLRAALGDA